jgi:hypothetical protein
MMFFFQDGIKKAREALPRGWEKANAGMSASAGNTNQ